MLDTIWSTARRRLRHALPDNDFETWIAPLRAARWIANEITLEAPSDFARDWLRRHFVADLERAVSEASGMPATVTVIVNRGLELPARGLHAPSPRTTPGRGARTSRYTFDSFVVGASNQVAFAAAQAVVARPGERFNPLFVYGDSGLGKTHLVNAVAHAAAVDGRCGAVVCLSAENFLNEMIAALENRQMPRFRRRFRDIDLLVLDDIQFLGGKRRSQEEFTHTFNALHDGRKQIVIASDRPPHALPGFEDALRTRLGAGLLACIEAPDPALRLALVRRKASERNLTLDPAVAEYLAADWCANGREIEGALVRLELYANVVDRPIDLALAREALGTPPSGRVRRPTVEQVIGEVCDEYRLSADELASSRRTARIVLPRQVAMFLCREQTDLPLKKIGERLGGRDHTTVVHGLLAVRKRLERDAALRELLTRVRARLGA